MLADLFKGARYLFRGFDQLLKPELRPFILWPLIINIVIFLAAMISGIFLLDDFMADMLPQGWEWLQWLLWPLFFLLFALTGFYTFTLVANFIGSPFNGVLSARVEWIESGQMPPESESSIPGIVWSSIAGELRKWVHFLKWILLLIIVSIIPVVNVLAPFCWMLLGSWMLVVEYADYPLGNHGMRLSSQVVWLKERMPLVMGFGAITLAASLVPVVNFAVMPAAVIGFTLLWLDQKQ